MGWLLKAITAGVVSFAATNIDDIFVLALFFGRLGRGLKVRHVVAGQYLGFSALVAISLVRYFARLIVPPEWIGLLGLLPIAIGVRHFLERDEGEDERPEAGRTAGGVLSVAAVTFDAGGFITVDLGWVYAGERLKVALVWDSNPASDYTTDPLNADLDLNVVGPGVSQWSSSWDNSYETVDFTVPASGNYQIKVKNYRFSGASEYFAVAWNRS